MAMLKTNDFSTYPQNWREDCMKWRGRVLWGHYRHYCSEWDCLPVDEWTPEFGCCTCFKGRLFLLVQRLNQIYWDWELEREYGKVRRRDKVK
jgi:hypothetical protein